MSQGLFWRIVKAGSPVHAGYIQGRASSREGVTGGVVTRFKVRQLSQWTARAQIWHHIYVTLSYSCCFFFFFALKAFLLALLKSKCFLSPTLTAQSAWKNCSRKLFTAILHLRTLMALIGLFMTHKLYLPLSYFFLLLLFPPLAFVFLPSRHAAE